MTIEGETLLTVLENPVTAQELTRRIETTPYRKRVFVDAAHDRGARNSDVDRIHDQLVRIHQSVVGRETGLLGRNQMR